VTIRLDHFVGVSQRNVRLAVEPRGVFLRSICLRSIWMKRHVVLALVVLCVVSIGRASAQGVVVPLPAEDSQRINSMLGPGVVGNPVPSKPIADGTVYFPLQAKTLTYQVTSGKNAGNTQTLGVARRSRPDGQQPGSPEYMRPYPIGSFPFQGRWIWWF